jgi:Tol biopolymer transport system component
MVRADVRRELRRAASIIGIAALAAILAAPVAVGGNTARSSVKGLKAQANHRSEEPSISSNGRFVAFNSKASNLVGNDENSVDDCFVRDHAQRRTLIVSVSSSGARANGACWGPAISANGRYVAFESAASDLVADDTNGRADIFVRDTVNGTTERVSVSSSGEQADGASEDPGISASGRFVVFESNASTLVGNDTNGRWDVFIHDRQTGETKRLSAGPSGQGNRDSTDPSISANGQFVVFESTASNLVGNDTNRRMDVFIRSLVNGKISRVSIQSDGGQARRGNSGNPSVSGDGRYVAFDSFAPNLVPGDTNRSPDVFLRDRKSGKTKRISVRSGGRQANAWSVDPTISTNGRYIAFSSAATNMVPNDTNRRWDGFVHDRTARKTKRVSVQSDGGQARAGDSHDVAISGDGRFVAFESLAKNLVSKDTNNRQDVFRRSGVR